MAIDGIRSSIESDVGHAEGLSLADIVGRQLNPVSDREIIRTLLGPRPASLDTAEALAEELWTRQDLWNRAFERLFPGLASITDATPATGTSVRTRNALLRYELDSWHTLALATPWQLADIPNLGRMSFTETVGRLLIAWADHCQSAPAPIARDDTPPGARHGLDGHLLRMTEVLRWLWRETGAQTIGDALVSWSGSEPPYEIEAIAQKLMDTGLDELLGLRAPDELAWRTLLDLPQRELMILRERIYPDRRAATLVELADRLDLTRERVRQIETRTHEHLAARLADGGDCASLIHLAARTARRIGLITDRASAIAAFEAAIAKSSEEPPTDHLRRNILMSLAGPYVEDGGLLISPAASRRLDAARRVVADTEPDAVLPESLIEDLMKELSVSPALEDALERHLRVRRIDARRVVWRGSLTDKAAAVLAATGETMTMLALHERLGLDVDPRYLANRLRGDGRIMRRGKEHYGLRSWGGKEYSGIMKELEQAIERAGGRIDLETTVQTFASVFGVSAQSVRGYASDRRFVRNDDGSLSIRT